MQLSLLGPFFSEALNSNQSATDILTSFLEHLSDSHFFRKTAHNLTPQAIKCIVYSVSGEQIISMGLWPPCSPDRNQCKFLLVKHVKG